MNHASVADVLKDGSGIGIGTTARRHLLEVTLPAETDLRDECLFGIGMLMHGVGHTRYINRSVLCIVINSVDHEAVFSRLEGYITTFRLPAGSTSSLDIRLIRVMK